MSSAPLSARCAAAFEAGNSAGKSIIRAEKPDREKAPPFPRCVAAEMQSQRDREAMASRTLLKHLARSSDARRPAGINVFSFEAKEGEKKKRSGLAR